MCAGFVPEGKPHEAIKLSWDLKAALDWHHSTFGSGAPGSEEEARRVCGSALCAALKDREAAATKAIPDPPLGSQDCEGARSRRRQLLRNTPTPRSGTLHVSCCMHAAVSTPPSSPPSVSSAAPMPWWRGRRSRCAAGSY